MSGPARRRELLLRELPTSAGAAFGSYCSSLDDAAMAGILSEAGKEAVRHTLAGPVGEVTPSTLAVEPTATATDASPWIVRRRMKMASLSQETPGGFGGGLGLDMMMAGGGGGGGGGAGGGDEDADDEVAGGGGVLSTLPPLGGLSLFGLGMDMPPLRIEEMATP